MTDYILMAVFALVLFIITVYKAKYHPNGNDNFFDKTNASGMRGIFSLIIIMIHVPIDYQNKLQLMIGGFAYIGVTYFFLTSAYGLTLKALKETPTNIATKEISEKSSKINFLKNNYQSVKGFWKNRLSKILVPQYLCNIFFVATALLTDPKKITLRSALGINIWVVWLLVFYFVFWIAHIFISNKALKHSLISAFVVALSLTGFYIRTNVIPDFLIWCPEMYGLIAGMLLALFFNKIKTFFKNKWIIKSIIGCVITLSLGILYLKTQTIVFFGNYVLKTILGITIITLILLFNSKISIGNKALDFLGKISFEIYLTHIGIMEVIAHFFPTVSSGIFITSTIIATIIISTLIHFVGVKVLNIKVGKSTNKTKG